MTLPPIIRYGATGVCVGMAIMILANREVPSQVVASPSDAVEHGLAVYPKSDGQPAPASRLFDAIREVESAGDDYAVGDGGASKGPYQIGRAYWSDSGLPWDYDECVWSRRHCEAVMLAYWQRYGARTNEQRARCHNSGPRWREKYPLTDRYWLRVQEAMQ